MLGDGHISPTQIIITLNNNEITYIKYVKFLIKKLFNATPHLCKTHGKNTTRSNVSDIYVGSVDMVKYFLNMGLVSNKVRFQVDIPKWIKINKKFVVGFLRGFFDTDGSIYKLRFGVQISYTNASIPLLRSTKTLLETLGYHPSKMSRNSKTSAFRIYLTKRIELCNFLNKIISANQKHIQRAKSFGII